MSRRDCLRLSFGCAAAAAIPSWVDAADGIASGSAISLAGRRIDRIPSTDFSGVAIIDPGRLAFGDLWTAGRDPFGSIGMRIERDGEDVAIWLEKKPIASAPVALKASIPMPAEQIRLGFRVSSTVGMQMVANGSLVAEATTAAAKIPLRLDGAPLGAIPEVRHRAVDLILLDDRRLLD